jgi:hypothetical protein
MAGHSALWNGDSQFDCNLITRQDRASNCLRTLWIPTFSGGVIRTLNGSALNSLPSCSFPSVLELRARRGDGTELQDICRQGKQNVLFDMKVLLIKLSHIF